MSIDFKSFIAGAIVGTLVGGTVYQIVRSSIARINMPTVTA